MNRHSLPTIGLASLVAGVYLLQVACDACARKGALNANDGAQVQSYQTSKSSPRPTAVPPVRELSEQVASGPGPTKEQVEHDAEHYRELAKAQGSRIGNGPDDLWLWVQGTYRFARTGSSIRVDVDQAVVTLRGTVQTKQDALTAIETIREIEGVRDVVNQLAIAGPQ